MSATIRRKLAALERAVTPKPERPAVMLFEPGPEATEEDRQRYREQIEAGSVVGALVVVVRQGSVRREHERGCVFVGSEAEAMILIAANQPGDEPGQTRLGEVFDQLTGVIMTPELARQRYPEGHRW